MLLETLLATQEETTWFEFKAKRMKAEDMGRWISALANGAFLEKEAYGYLIFGIDAKTKTVKGVNQFWPMRIPKNEDLQATILPDLSPRINFEIHELIREEDKKKIIFVKIPAGSKKVRFKGKAYILYLKESSGSV